MKSFDFKAKKPERNGEKESNERRKRCQRKKRSLFIEKKLINHKMWGDVILVKLSINE